MTSLPKIKYSESASQRQIVQFAGLNFSDTAQEGQAKECRNLSARRFPYLTTRLRREAVGDYVAPTAVTAWDKLVVVDGTSLIYDGAVVGSVTAGEKQFAVVNTKLVIWPDKVYLDLLTRKIVPMGASAQQAGAVFTTDTITMSGTTLSSLFSKGDGVTISGCTVNAANNKDAVVVSVGEHTVTFSANALTAGTETANITIQRRIPDLDYICESQNRLWGCSNADKTIYASALGDPCNFFVYSGISTDSYALSIGSAGLFTGCCKLASSVLFWKENTLHKILGSYPEEYNMYPSNIAGVQDGSYKSMQIINDVLFYKAPDGVYAYSGGTPERISAVFGERRYYDAAAGTDGSRYYISMRYGTTYHLLVYDTVSGIWTEEDETEAVDFCRYRTYLYMLSSDGSLWSVDADAGTEIVPWSVTFAPFYETANGKKYYSTLFIRLELAAGARAEAETRCDGGAWESAGKLLTAGTALLPIRPRRCDKFEIRLSGVGECAVLSMVRQFRVGSEV
jgi:hypothetical protein